MAEHSDPGNQSDPKENPMSKKRKSKEPKSPNRMMLRRTLFLLIVCGIVAFIVLGVRLYIIQIVHHDEYEAAAMEQQLRETTVSAKRGTIYDRNMNILAMSASTSNIYISPAEIEMYDEDAELIASTLAEILDLEYDDIYELTQNTSSWYTTVARKVDDDIAEQVRAFKEEYGLMSVKIEESSKRYYPYSSLACHVIGYVGSDDYGLAGIEYYYDDDLSGTDGRIVRATNANGTDMMFTDYEDYYDAEDGYSLVLTIDETVQYYLETALEEAVEDYMCSDGAAGIVMDVNTGAVLGMASIGNFDLNDYLTISDEDQAEADAAETEEERDEIISTARSLQWRNKAISDTYEPGSTFKIITLAMALESGAITMDSTFYCGGSMSVLGRTTELNCWSSSGHGTETLTQAVMNSCNIAFVNIGLSVGAETFYEYAEAFGLFDTTGIDLPGEASSIWWDEETFYDEDNKSQLAAASFGQTFTITPIQLITAVSAVANGGYLMQPYVVDQVLDSDGNIISQTEPTVVRQVISEETSALCCEILKQVVGNSSGTGKNAYVAGYRVAGKTGTSEDVTYEASTGSKKYIVSFIGFAPADDPEVCVLVLLKDPSSASGTYVSGGQMAAPTVGTILSNILPYLGVEPEYTDEEEELVDKTVPRLVGKTVAEAEAALEELGLDYRVVGDGDSVTDQLPKSNSTVAAGSEIVLYCGEEASTEQVTMLDLTGLDYETARIRMGWYGLYIKAEGTLLESSTVTVVKQSVEAGELVDEGTVVTVTLSDSSNLGRY